MFLGCQPLHSGCRMRHIGFPRGLEKWKERFKVHRGIWRALDAVFKDKLNRKGVWLFQEWPQHCDLFVDKYYLSIAKRLGLIYRAEVSRCCLDGIQKTWRIMTNSERSSQLISCPKENCKCVNKAQVPLGESGFYSMEVAQWFVKSMREAVREWENGE